MCCPWGPSRREQTQVARGQVEVPLLADDALAIEPLRVGGDRANDIAIDCCSLIRLEVQGAEPVLDRGRHWAVVDAGCVITVRAVTQPDSGGAWRHVDWGGEATQQDNSELVLPRSARLSGRQVSATLRDQAQTVQIEVVDLLGISAPHLLALGGNPPKWKAYESAQPARLVATTDPSEAWVHQQLQWKGAVSAGPGLAELDLSWPAPQAHDSTPIVRRVSVALGTVCPKTVFGVVRVCRWPILQLSGVSFSGYIACNDGVAELGQPFDRNWQPGRPDPAPHQPAANSQSPLTFAGGDPVQLIAWFDVVQPPSEAETVRICGTANLGGVALTWEQDVIVNPGDASVTFPLITSAVALPAVVHAGRLQVDWTMTTPDQPVPHLAIGSSDNPLYLLLGPPQPANRLLYLTWLDLSCTGGNGTIDEATFVPAAFSPLIISVGDGNGIERKGDGVQLTYYLEGTNTPANNDVWVTHDILGSVQATARCGGWKDMLQHMYAMHGVTTDGLACVRQTASGTPDYDLRFLAAHNACVGVAGDPLAAPYTHLGDAINADPDVPGQGKTNPQFEFGDHVVLWHGNNIYDPSYGVGPIPAALGAVMPATLAYETAAIGGFGDASGRSYDQFSSDLTSQIFAEKIGERCLMEHVCSAGQTLQQIVRQHALRVYPGLARGPARAALGNQLLASGYPAGPYAAGDRVVMVQPRSQVVLAWSWN